MCLYYVEELYLYKYVENQELKILSIMFFGTSCILNDWLN